MKNTFNLPALLIILTFTSCIIFSSKTTEVIKIECQKDNINTQYKQIQTFIGSINQKKINDEIRKEFPEIKDKNFNNITLQTIKREQRFSKTINGVNSVNETYNVDIEIDIKFNKANSNQAFQIIEYYKKYIVKELTKFNISIK